MARMRANKKKLRDILDGNDWQSGLDEIVSAGMASVGPLFSLLLHHPLLRHRASRALGLTLAALARSNTEEAKNVVRRFMWHMNEESGNIGWGIPEAFAETLAASPILAKTYYSILISYIIDLGHDDNYCDNDILRRSCYWAIGRFAEANPELAEKARPWLLAGLQDQDSICRGMAAWALGKLGPTFMEAPALKKLANAQNNDPCEIYDNGQITIKAVSEVAKETLALALGVSNGQTQS